MSDQERIRDLEGRLHVAQVRARFFMEENVRLRNRIHEAVDECQRRFAPDIAELTRRRWVAVWAQEELEKFWTGRNSHVSTLGHSILEHFISERNEAREELRRIKENVA